MLNSERDYDTAIPAQWFLRNLIDIAGTETLYRTVRAIKIFTANVFALP